MNAACRGKYMECLNYGCNDSPKYGFPCCSITCGYQYKTEKGKLEQVFADKTDWKDPFWGIKYWTTEKYLYFKQLI